MLLVNGYRKTTAPGEREERHQRDLSYNNSSRDEQVDTRLATYPRNLIIDTLSLPLPLLAPWCAQRLATLSYTFARSFSFNHLQAKSTCLKKRCKHRNSGRIPSLIGSLTPAHGRLSRNMINNFCKRIISHPVKSQYLKYATRYIFTNMTSSKISYMKIDFFLCNINFRTHRIINYDRKHSKKNSRKADRKGGGINAYGP